MSSARTALPRRLAAGLLVTSALASASPLLAADRFWDGSQTTANNAVDGGTGTWTATGTNWTSPDGSVNAPFDPADLLIFSGTPGEVTVDDSVSGIVLTGGLRFDVDGYSLTGSGITLGSGAIIRVGDGTAAGAGFTATIASSLTGLGSLTKTDLGTLALTGASTFAGNANVTGGRLAVTGPGALLTLTGGTLDVRGATSVLNVTGGGRIEAPNALSGLIDGGGGALVDGAGSSVTVGKLVIGFTGEGAVTVSNGGSLVTTDTSAPNFSPIFSLTVGGAGNNAGSQINLAGTARGTLIATGAGSLVSTPVLRIGQGTTAVSGDPTPEVARGTVRIENGARLVTTNIASIGYGGRDSGGGTLTVTGVGTIWEATGTIEVVGADSQILIADGASVTRPSGASWNITVPRGVLITGAGTTADLGNVNVATGSFDEAQAGLIVEDGATVTALNLNSATSTSLGPDSGAIVVRSGGSLSFASGGLGFSSSRGLLLVDNGTLNVSGTLSVGSSFTTNASTVVLSNAAATFGSLFLAQGILVIGGRAGEAAGGAGTFSANSLFIGNTPGVTSELVLNHTGIAFDLNAPISGSGIIRHIAGNTIFSRQSPSFSGQTIVTGGDIAVTGRLGDNAHRLEMSGGGVLSGSGFIGGGVTLADATLAPGAGLGAGNGPSTLSITGALVLGEESVLDFDLGEPGIIGSGVNDLIQVGGALTLDGTLNVRALTGFGAGLYRLINYGGALTDNGLEIGAVPDGFDAAGFTIQTNIAGQVNLVAPDGSTPVGNFIFWDGSDSVADNAIAGGTGTWTVTGTNWTLADGSANGAYDPADFLIFSAASGTVTIDNGPGAVSIANGAQFAANGYTVAGGALTLATGDITIRVGDGTADGAGFVATISAPVTGGGRLVKTDLGTLILSGSNDYTGGTLVQTGRLQGDTVSLQGAIAIDGTLTFDQRVAGTFAGTLGGTGLIEKAAAGALTLTGDSGAFAGTTDINAGALLVNGALGGGVRVNATALLGGTGTTGNVTVASGGTIAPGNSIGTLTVGNITFAAGSTFQVELNDGGTVAGVNNDRVLATGNATINGGTIHVTPANGTDDGRTYARGATYTVLTSTGALTGRFTAVTDDFAFLDFIDSYDGNNVYLTAQVRSCPTGLTFNQGDTCDGVLSLTGGDLLAAVLNLSDAEAPVALDRLSGELYASLDTALFEDSRFPREAALARLAAAEGNGGTGAWGAGFGSWGERDGDGNAAALDRSIGGFFLGGDAAAGENARIGLFGGYSHTSFDLPARGSTGSVDTWHLGAYAGGRWGSFAARIGAAYAWHDMSLRRAVSFTGFSDTLSADYDVNTGQVFGELGYRIAVGPGHVEPFAGFAWVHLGSGDYAESGGAAALRGESAGADGAIATLGLRADWRIDTGGAAIMLNGSAAWRHAFGDLEAPAVHAFAGGDRFVVAGVPVAQDTLALDLGIASQIGQRVSLGLSYSGQYGSGLTDHGVQASVHIAF